MTSVGSFTHVSNTSMLILAQARQRQLERQRQLRRQKQVVDVASKPRRRRYDWCSCSGGVILSSGKLRVRDHVRLRSRDLKSGSNSCLLYTSDAADEL